MRERPSVLSIGNFDGVHVGHSALLRRCGEIARGHGDAEVVALAFDPHPVSLLRPEKAPAKLSDWAQREASLREAGADRAVRLEPTPELLDLEPAGFLDWIVERFRPVAIVEGPDFQFGRGRGGDVGTMADLGASRGFEVSVVDPVDVALTDCTVARASSTLTRWLVAHGRVRDAARVLGRPYEIVGEVVRGDRRGRKIGYPTCNLRTANLAPADGVYAAEAELPDGRTFAAAVSVGTNPHFDRDGRIQRRVEAHLLDCPAEEDRIEGLEEYLWRLRVRLLGFVRDQGVFASLGDLLGQMARDCGVCREIANDGSWLESEVAVGG